MQCCSIKVIMDNYKKPKAEGPTNRLKELFHRKCSAILLTSGVTQSLSCIRFPQQQQRPLRKTQSKRSAAPMTTRWRRTRIWRPTATIRSRAAPRRCSRCPTTWTLCASRSMLGELLHIYNMV